MVLVLHGPSYNPSLPMITPEALAGDINTELADFWLPLAGGALGGPLSLPADPTANLQAATKQYVDNLIARSGGPFLPLAGGVVAGTLGVSGITTLTGGVNGNAVFGIGSGGNGTGLTVNNGAQVSRLNIPTNTRTWTPSSVQDASTSALFSAGQTVTGTMGSVDGAVWLFGVNSNNIDNTNAPDPFMPFKVQTNFGATRGSIGAFSISQAQTSDLLDADGLTRFYTALQVTQFLAHRAGNQSNAVGFNVVVNQGSGSTGWSNLEVAELGVARVPGTSIVNANVLGLIHTNTSGNHATSTESYVHMLAGGGTTSANTGILLGSPGAQWPIDPTNGWVIDTVCQVANNPGNAQRMPQAAAGGFDFSQVNFSDSVMRSPGIRLRGIPEIDIGPAAISANSTGAQIDVVRLKGTLGSVIAAGAGYQVGDQLYDGNGGIITVTAVNASGNITAASYIAGKEPYWSGGGAPTTVSTTGGSGNSLATFNVTWTAQTRLSLQPSGGAIVMPLLTNAANDAAAAGAGVAVGQIYRNGSVLMQRVA